MAQFKIETTLTVDTVTSGKLPITTTKTITYTAKEDKEFVIAAAGEQIIWNPTVNASEASSTFTFLYILSDGDADVELITDMGAEVGLASSTVQVVADIPFVLGSDASYANVTAGSALSTGTVDLTEKIVIKNTTAAAINVQVILGS